MGPPGEPGRRARRRRRARDAARTGKAGSERRKIEPGTEQSERTRNGGRDLISINYRDPRPIYEQVKDGFRQLILSGVLPTDTKLPSVRELATSLTINPNTIQRAYRELEGEGYIVSVPGVGSFVSDAAQAAEDQKRILKEKLEKLLQELRALGVSREELIELIDGGEKE